jgi:post-segregation antitoxin (ccd killing protein)
MPKMQVYLPDSLYQRLAAEPTRLNVSGILQEALERELEQLDRDKALNRALEEYQRKRGVITPAELAEADSILENAPRSGRARTKSKQSSRVA